MVCKYISLPNLALFLDLAVNSLFSHIDIWQWGRRTCIFPKSSQEICLAVSRERKFSKEHPVVSTPFKLYSVACSICHMHQSDICHEHSEGFKGVRWDGLVCAEGIPHLGNLWAPSLLTSPHSLYFCHAGSGTHVSIAWLDSPRNRISVGSPNQPPPQRWV